MRRALGTAVLAWALVSVAVPTTAHAVDAPAPVAVIGDFGSGTDDERQVADLVSGSTPAAIVTTGDNVYDSADYPRLVGDYYGAYAAAADLLPATGNHDHAEGIRAFDAYFAYLGGRHVYAAGRGGMRFFILDSTTALASRASMARQKAWLQRALTRSTARWKVVVLHHPPYSSGTRHGSSPEFRWPFRQWGADLVVSGHEHNYERIVSGGLTYVVDGSGGKELTALGDRVPGSQAGDDSDFGALFLSASSDGLTGEFRTVDGRIADRFSLRP